MAKNKKEIPLVFALDDNYAPFLSVALKSILDNANSENFYSVYLLNTHLKEDIKAKLSEFNCESMKIQFVDVAMRMEKINKDKIHLRDYYTQAIYYRIFIPSIFPQYDKILYVDCDVVLLDDIANLYNLDPEDNIFIAVHEETMSHINLFGEYSERFLGVERNRYFNSGILLINCKAYKKANIEERFIALMHRQKFEVAPDQDYLNVLCKDKVKYAPIGWNKTPFPDLEFDEREVKLVHYKLNFKPWRYSNVKYGCYFWKYAKETPFYDELIKMFNDWSDLDKANDDNAFVALKKTAVKYTNNPCNYKNSFRLKV